MTDLTPTPDEVEASRTYAPVRVHVPADVLEVYTQDGRVLYDLGSLVRDLEGQFAAMGIAVSIFGSDEDCARMNGRFDTVEVMKGLHDGLALRGMTHE